MDEKSLRARIHGYQMIEYDVLKRFFVCFNAVFEVDPFSPKSWMKTFAFVPAPFKGVLFVVDGYMDVGDRCWRRKKIPTSI